MAIDFVYWLAQTPQDHQQQFVDAQRRGYKTVSLCLSGRVQAPRITAVMLKDPAHASESFELMPEHAWSTTLASKAGQGGVGPCIVSGVGPGGAAVFAAVFRAVDPSQQVLKDLDSNGLAAQQDLAWRSGQILGSIDAYGTATAPRFVAVWVPNVSPVAWNLDAASTLRPRADFERRLNAIAAQRGRLSLVTGTPGRRFLGLFVDDRVPHWNAEFDLDATALEARITAMQRRGLAPLRICAKGDAASLRFSVLFADSEQASPRTFRSHGPTSITALDGLMEGFMRANATRGASLAVTSGTRLVYVRGYTFAEPDEPDVLPTTLFRLASVSKLLGAIAIQQLIQQGSAALDQTVQSILGLKSPGGGPPADPRFGCVTLRDLLTMTSAVDQSAFWQSDVAAQASGKPLPATPEQMLSLIASRSLSANPGNWDNAAYNNTGYFVLGQVAARVRGEADFAGTIVKPLLVPLGITRIRGSRSLLADQPADEARYYLVNLKRSSDADDLLSLDVGSSIRTADRPTVPGQYGVGDFEMYGAGGGMSAAATDLARILAALTWRDKRNPMLSDTSLEVFFGNAVRATAVLTGPDAHGYFGWDGAWLNPDDSVMACKGGWLGGDQSFAWLSTQGDGMGVVLLINTNEQDESDTGFGFGDLLNKVTGQAAMQDWSMAPDLFVNFGMPPLVPQPIVKPPPLLQPAKALSQRVKQVAAAERVSMTPRPGVATTPARAAPRGRKRPAQRG